VVAKIILSADASPASDGNTTDFELKGATSAPPPQVSSSGGDR
jgi:hypothetical protein